MALSAIDHGLIKTLREIQKRSHDPHRPVAVLIADPAGKVLATGVNEPPESYHFDVSATHDAISKDPKWKYYMLEHAERNAILNAVNKGVSLKGSTMYGTLFPCADCARAVVAAGIKRLVVPESGINPIRDEKWREHYVYASRIFELSDISIDYYLPAELHDLLPSSTG